MHRSPANVDPPPAHRPAAFQAGLRIHHLHAQHSTCHQGGVIRKGCAELAFPPDAAQCTCVQVTCPRLPTPCAQTCGVPDRAQDLSPACKAQHMSSERCNQEGLCCSSCACFPPDAAQCTGHLPTSPHPLRTDLRRSSQGSGSTACMFRTAHFIGGC